MIERKELGYLLLDNRLSGGQRLEASTYTCTHCGGVVVLNPERQRERAKCHSCRHQICDHCAAAYYQTHECRPLSRAIDEHFERVVRGAPSTPLIVTG
jgi:hypothetical protein